MKKYDEGTRKIQDAFMKIFAKKPLHEITVKSVCDRAGIFRTTFRSTLLYIKENEFWFRTLLNKSRDGMFIYKWKKVIKEDFLKKFRHENIDIKEEELVLEMISSGCIGAYTYWVNNLDHVPIEVVEREVLDRLCRDFFVENPTF